MGTTHGYGIKLQPQHAEYLKQRGVSPKQAEERGYASIDTKAALKRLGFQNYQCSTPGLLSPVRGLTGGVSSYQYRPDEPRIKDGKPVKFEAPGKSRMGLDIPPGVRDRLADPRANLFITEGIVKADAAVSAGLACIALLGVTCWRGSNEQGGKVALPEWESIALNDGRPVFIAFDSDVMTKREVHAALARLKSFLEHRGAHVRVIYLPSGEGGVKVGLDDYLAAGHTVDELLALASDELRLPPSDGAHDDGQYRETPGGLEWVKSTQDGEVPVRLTNFTARIVADVAEDDGAETRRLFEMEAKLNARPHRFSVPAERFAGMGWVVEHLGASAVVYPGFGTRDHARAAIQIKSGDIPERRAYTHIGWRQLGETWAYLHAGGAIGPDGPVPEVDVRLLEGLHRYILPDPPRGGDEIAAVQSSLGLLTVAPHRITVPGYSAPWRAILGRADQSNHFAGPTGAGKTELAALLQQHFGPAMDARNLPGSWSSTGNSLEMMAFYVKDAILTVDDFCPTGSPIDVQRYHREADRLFRAQGNASGRGRLRPDGTPRAAKPPRGFIQSTGEDVPAGQSLRARVAVLEVGRMT